MLPVIFRDQYLIAVHKPSGLLVHRSEIDRHETRFALQMVRDQTGCRVHAVHRLDKGTSGILLFAFDSATAGLLGKAFDAGQVDKQYLAIVRGWPGGSGEWMQLDHALSVIDDVYANRSLGGRQKLTRLPEGEKAGAGFCIEAVEKVAQAARTRYRMLAGAELPHRVDRYPTSRYALVELNPLTGRRHQLRRHLKHLSHPIVGDATYGKGRHNRLFQTLFGTARLLLACTGMGFVHPASGQRLSLLAAPAEDFLLVARGLGMAVEATEL